MNEIISSVGSWFARNGSASDWFTSFGTVGAVFISLYILIRKPKIKVLLRTKKVSRGDREIKIPNSSDGFGPTLEVKIRNSGSVPVEVDELVLLLMIDDEELIVDFGFYEVSIERIEEYSQEKIEIKISQIMKWFRLNPEELKRFKSMKVRVLLIDQFNRKRYSPQVDLNYYLTEYQNLYK